MDPQACLSQLLDALNTDTVDLLEINEIARDLGNWLHKGGFPPTLSKEQTEQVLKSWTQLLTMSTAVGILGKSQCREI